MIGRGVAAVLVEEGAIVVAGDGGLITLGVVRPRREPEIGAAVEHIKVEARAAVEEGFHLFQHTLISPGVVLLTEVIEPPAPELRAHLGSVLLHLFERGETPRDIAAEVDGDERARGASARKHIGTGAVRREEEHLCTALLHDTFEGGEIGLVVAVAAVLVLHLHGDDRSALGALKVAHLLHHPRDVVAHMGEIDRVVASQAQIFVREQPCGEPARVPLRADVRTGTQDDVKPQLPRGLDVAADVQPPGEIELPFLRLVEIPAHIGLHGVEAAGFEL